MTVFRPRRFLPALPLLMAFEAAARTRSITQAARELSLTQSAVSRQVKALEEQLGVELFIRDKQKIRLTLGGEIYARDIRDALTKISSASLNLLANPQGETLTLAVPPTFGARWLTPKLADFNARHPEISLNLLSRLDKFDFSNEVIDAAIYCGGKDWAGAEMQVLCRETVIPVCAPEMRARYDFKRPADVRAAPLLHLDSRPDAWEQWMRAHTVDDHAVRGMLVDQFNTLLEAAASGLGVALVPVFLANQDLAAGRIVRALTAPMLTKEAYHLCWPEERGTYQPLVIFRHWLMGQFEKAEGQDIPCLT